MYMYVPCLKFQNRYFAYCKVGHVLVNIELIFMSLVTISSCFISLFQGHVSLVKILPKQGLGMLLLFSKGKNI